MSGNFGEKSQAYGLPLLEGKGESEGEYGPHLPKPHRAWGPRSPLHPEEEMVCSPLAETSQGLGTTVEGMVWSPFLQFPSPPKHALLLDLVGSIHCHQENMWNLIAYR